MSSTHEHIEGSGHGHTHGPSDSSRAFVWGVALNLGFVAVEWLFGVMANSLALIADASHNLGDVLGLVLAWGAAALARRGPSARFTYGMRSSTILAALANAVVLLVVTGGIGWEALLRFRHPSTVDEHTVIWVALVGILINGATAMLFMAGRDADLNIRGAFLHMAADAAVSLGVVVAGVGMLITRWAWLDTAVSLAIVAIILWSTAALLRDALRLALQAVPDGIDPAQVHRYLSTQPGVTEVHDLHIWAMSTTETALTAHVVMPAGHPGDDFLAELGASIERQFGIAHTTVQVETGSGSQACALAPEHVV